MVAKKTHPKQPGKKNMGWGEMFGCKKHPRVVAHKYSCEKPVHLSRWNPPDKQVCCMLLISCKQLCFNNKVKEEWTVTN